ncbi:MAG: Lrp/AsnC family transcriptional regulator [Fimbriimonadaceae bacterium]
MIDAIDAKILKIIRTEGRISNAEVARQIGMAPSAVLERLRKLEARGIITGYEAKMNPESLGLGLLAFIRVRADEPVHSMGVGEALAAFPEVLEVHYVAGEDGYLVKVRTKDANELGAFLRDKVGSIPGITSTMSTIVLTTVKETSALPVPEEEAKR